MRIRSASGPMTASVRVRRGDSGSRDRWFLSSTMPCASMVAARAWWAATSMREASSVNAGASKMP